MENDFNAEYSKRCQKVEKVTEEKEEGTWMSWKQVTDIDGEALEKAQIACGKIETRLHKRLDHDHAYVQDMPAELKLEYKKVEDSAK